MKDECFARLMRSIDGKRIRNADRNGAKLLPDQVESEFPRLQHMWADMGYRGQVVAWIKEQLGWTIEIVKQPRRWFVERTFAWLGRYWRMSKDYEY